MKKASYEAVLLGLDQLFMSEVLGKSMTTEERAEAIDTFLKSTGWDWDQVINHLVDDKDVNSLSN
jgi:hypothetical protein